MESTRAQAVVPALPARADAAAAPLTSGPVRSYLRGSAVLLLGRLVSVVLNFAVQVLIIRYLAKSDYGAFAMALAVVSIASSAVLLGLGKGIPRLVPIYLERQDYARVFGSMALALGTVLGLGVSLALALHGLRGAASGLVADPRSLSLLLILIALAPLDAVDHLLQQLIAVFASPRAIFIRRHVLGPGFKLLTILLVMLVAGDARLLAYGYVIGGLVGVWLYVAVLLREWRRTGLLPHLRPARLRLPVRELFGFSLPLLSSELAVLWRRPITIFLLGSLATATSVAEYRAVVSIAGLNTLAFEAFAILFVPHASRMFARDDRAGISDLYWQTSLWVSVLTFPVFAVTCVLAEPLTVLLFGAPYAGTGTLLALLSVGHYVHATLGFNSFALRVHGKLRVTVVSDFVAAALVVGANLLLIPSHGALGAAAGTTGVMVLHTAFNHLGLRVGDTGIRLVDWRFVRVHLVVLGLMAALVLCQQLLEPPFLVTVALTAVAFLVVVRLTRRAVQAEAILPELLRIPGVRQLFT